MSGLAATLVRRRLLPLRRAIPAPSPRLKRRLLVLALLALALAGAYMFWLRDSSLVAVEDVKVTGLTTADSQRVRDSLTTAAREMTTLHVDRDRLERAVASYPVVRDLQMEADFPHGLTVRVVERVAAALAVSDAAKLPVAGDGTILRGIPIEGHLPTIEVDGVLGAEHLQDAKARAAAAVAGAAPAVLRRRVELVERRSEDGLVAELRDGPELIFGSPEKLQAKWAAAARILADPEARGASYIDLRIPSRPAAGGLPTETVTPVAPAGTPTPETPPAADPAATDANAAEVPADPSLGTPADPAATTPSTPTTPPPTNPTVPGATTPTTPAPSAPAEPQAAPAGGVEGGTAAPTTP